MRRKSTTNVTLQQIEETLVHAALWANPIVGDVLPAGSRCDAGIGITLRLVEDVTTCGAFKFPVRSHRIWFGDLLKRS